MALTAFALRIGGDVVVILGKLMDSAAVGGVEVEGHRIAGFTDTANPLFGLAFNALRMLFFVVGNVNIDASELSLVAGQGHGDDGLEGAEIVGVFTDEEAVELR